MVSWKSLAVALAASSVVSASTKCGPGSKCPKDSPCCDEYGECGTGRNCLGGCDPRYSYTLDACMPMPACQAGTTTFDGDAVDSIGKIEKFLGDASKTPWVYTGNVLEYDSDNAVLITMPKDSTGTVLSTTHYVWYGNLKAKMKTSHLQGVVTDFIMLSNVKDEIDYEFVGSDLTHAQTNYYFQGVTDYTKQVKAQVSDTYDNYHTYEVDWTEDKIDWKIDGNTVRTLNKDDTYNDTTKAYDFPQSPARLQLGIWPGGDSSQGEGTIEWAGGDIDWNSDDIKKNGYYYAAIKEVEISCYDPPSDVKKNGTKAYKYTDVAGLQSDIVITDDSTVLEDSGSSGIDNTPPKDVSQVSESKTKTKSIPNASEVSSKAKKTSTKSIPDASQVTSKGKSSGSSNAKKTSDGGFSQGDDDDSSSSSSSAGSGSGSAAAQTASDNGATMYTISGSLFFVGAAILSLI